MLDDSLPFEVTDAEEWEANFGGSQGITEFPSPSKDTKLANDLMDELDAGKGKAPQTSTSPPPKKHKGHLRLKPSHSTIPECAFTFEATLLSKLRPGKRPSGFWGTTPTQ